MNLYTLICACIRACRMRIVVNVCVQRACVRGDGGQVSIRVYAHVYVLAVCVM